MKELRPPEKGDRVMWLTGPQAGRRGIMYNLAVRTSPWRGAPVKYGVLWDDTGRIGYYLHVNWGKQLGPLPLLDVMAEL